MLGYIKNTLGLVTVQETETEIIVEGVPGYFIQNDISRLWKTSRLGNYLFKRVTRNSFTIHKFFALDLLYLLEEIINYTGSKSIAASKRTAKKVIDALYEDSWLRRTKEVNPDILDFSKLNLFWKSPLDYQKEFLDRYNVAVSAYQLKGYLLNGAAGSGKTYTAMVLAECLHSDFIVVICPSNAVQTVWEASVKSEYKDSPSYWSVGSGKPYEGQKYLICHYEAESKLLTLLKNEPLDGKITVILDESHNLNEETSQQTRNFLEICKLTKSENIVFASGTPIKALGSESITLFTAIDPYFTDEVKVNFKKLYGKDAKKALDVLNNRLNLVSHVIEKSRLKLAPPIMQNIKVKAPGAEAFTLSKIKDEMIAFIEERTQYYQQHRSEYVAYFEKCLKFFEDNTLNKNSLKSLETYRTYIKRIQTLPLEAVKEEIMFCNKFEQNDIIPTLPAEWRKDFKEIKTIIKYVALKIQGECLGRILGKRRTECIQLVAKHIDYVGLVESTEKKTLVFTSYVDALKTAKQRCEELELNPIVVFADTNKDLNEIVQQFAKDENLNPLIATYKSLSTAVPLTMADVLVLLNTPFRDYILQQAISRIHRLGSDTQTTVYVALLDTDNEPNLSTRTLDILKWSQDQVSAITGVKSPFEVNDSKISLETYQVEDKQYTDFTLVLEELGIEETQQYELKDVVVESFKKPIFGNW